MSKPDRIAHPLRICGAFGNVLRSQPMTSDDQDEPKMPRGLDERADAEIRIAIGRNLRRVRELIDENRSRLAEEFGVTGMAWQKWENGTRYPSVPVMLEFCRKYRVRLEFIYEGRMENLEPGLQRRLYKRYPELLDEKDAPRVGADESDAVHEAAKGRRRPKRRPPVEHNAGA